MKKSKKLQKLQKKKIFKTIKRNSKKKIKRKTKKTKIRNKKKKRNIINIGGGINGNINLDLDKPLTQANYNIVINTKDSGSEQTKIFEFITEKQPKKYQEYNRFLEDFEAAAEKKNMYRNFEQIYEISKRSGQKWLYKRKTFRIGTVYSNLQPGNLYITFKIIGNVEYPRNLYEHIYDNKTKPTTLIKDKNPKDKNAIRIFIKQYIRSSQQGGTRKHEYKKITEYKAKGGANNDEPNIIEDDYKVVYIENDTAHIFVIGGQVRDLFNYLFREVSGNAHIKNLIFYGTLTVIPQNALCYFYHIRTISFEPCPFTGDIPNIQTIGQGALQGSTDLTYYNYSPVWIFGSQTSHTINIMGYSCSFLKLTELDFSYCTQSITIGEGAFYSCENLSKIIFPQDAYLLPGNDGIITIGAGAFQNCFNLREIYIFIIPPWEYADNAIIENWITYHIDTIFGSSLMYNHVDKGSTINGLSVNDYITGFCTTVKDANEKHAELSQPPS